MQVIVNIGDDGAVTTEVKREPAMLKATTTAEAGNLDTEHLDAGASPYAIAESAETLEDKPFDVLLGLDGGAGPIG